MTTPYHYSHYKLSLWFKEGKPLPISKGSGNPKIKDYYSVSYMHFTVIWQPELIGHML